MPVWFASIISIIIKALFGAIRQGVDDARDDHAHEDVGVLRQKQADSEAAIRARDEANVVALEPRDRAVTRGRLRDGRF
jgi:hypothetical protein